MSCQPLFLFGVARSGTNLLAGMLNARADVRIALDPLMPYFKALRSAIVAATGEADLNARYPASAAFQDYYFDSAGVRLMDATMSGSLDLPVGDDAALAEAVARRAALESRTLPDVLAKVRGKTFAAFLAELAAAIEQSADVRLRRCGTKEVWATEFLPVIARAMPQARFVVIRRDPRAILASLIAMMRLDPTQTAHTISYMRHWRKEAAALDIIAADPSLRARTLVMHYEAITASPERAARDICGFLDLPFDAAMLTPAAADGSAFRGNSSFGEFEGIAATSNDRWQQVLDADTVRTIECLCGPEMRAEGYEPVNVWPILPDAAVQRVTAQADANPGSWRSDSGDAGADTAAERERWDMLTGRKTFPAPDVRRHFLTEAFFDKLRAAAPQMPTAAVAGAR